MLNARAEQRDYARAIDAILSNVLFIAYATLMGRIPILVLHVALPAINIIHLASEVRKPARSGC